MNTRQSILLKSYFDERPDVISAVVPFNKQSDKLYHFDFTAANFELSPSILTDTAAFSDWVSQSLNKHNCRYGIGGYNEHRTIYSRSELFDKDEEPRRLHLGTDVWGPAGTPIYSPLDGVVHSFRFNDKFGDYGATIILEHNVNGIKFHTLYGHLNLASIKNLIQHTPVRSGEKIAEFGNIAENGNWPPHLHFQLIFNMEGMVGDYPGVCRFSEKEIFLRNCPNPDILLKHTFGY